MSYDRYFANSIARLRREHRYRNFIELERLAGRFPRALWDAPEGPREVVIWCSNDDLESQDAASTGPICAKGLLEFRDNVRAVQD